MSLLPRLAVFDDDVDCRLKIEFNHEVDQELWTLN